MPKYLIAGHYGPEGVKGLLKEGGSNRRAVVEKAIKSVGGKVDAFYYAFGDTDLYAIVDMPDNVSLTAVGLVINSSGAASMKTTVLITPEEVDEAAKKTLTYRPPGQ
ncbi:MAG: GYD domain-containing protein [Anaerolineae bacterium]